jgi:hypothetical protein
MRGRKRQFKSVLYKTKTDMQHFFLIGVTLLTSTLCFSQKQLVVGQTITGDFNGDGKADTAFLKVKTNSKSNVHSWTLSFNDKNIPAMPLGCCDVILINEGDLNGDKTTEISVFQAPENGCVYMWATYSLKTNRWTKFIEPFLIATDCEDFKQAGPSKQSVQRKWQSVLLGR